MSNTGYSQKRLAENSSQSISVLALMFTPFKKKKATPKKEQPFPENNSRGFICNQTATLYHYKTTIQIKFR